MGVNHLTADERNAIKREMLRLMASKTGVDGLLELLVELTEDMGDGKVPGGPREKRQNNDSFWTEVSAYLDTAHRKICELLNRSEIK